MIHAKVHFPIFSLLIAVLLLLSSCNNQKELSKKTDPYNTTLDRALVYYDKQQYDSAYFFFNKAKSLCSKDEKDQMVFPLIYMAEIEQMECDFSSSEATVTEALGLVSDTRYLPSLYNLLGIAYQEQYNFSNALKYYHQCLKVTSDESAKNIIYNNIGHCYLESGAYSSAIAVLNPLLAKQSLQKDKKIYAKVLDNLGFAYLKLNSNKAFNYLNKSRILRDSLQDSFDLIASDMHLSEYYLNANTELANVFAHKAYTAAAKVKSPDDKIEALKFLIATSKDSPSKEFALQQIQLSDSIAKVRQIAKNQFAKIKYDSKKAIQDSQRYKAEKQFYLILCIGVCILFSLVYFIIRWRNQRKLRAETYNTEVRIAKKLHDELANDVFNAMTYAETQNLQNESVKEVLVDHLEHIYIRTRNISKENSEIETNDQYESVLKDLLSNYSNAQVNVIVNRINTIDWNKIKRESKIVVYRVLQELMVNMKKHSQCSLVVIRFESLKNKVEISYTDNGIGCDELINLKKGLQNAENRILAINGSITFESESNKGFKVKMIIPK